MKYKILSGKGAILGQNEMENYLEKLASGHILQNKSDKNTYPIPRLKENFEIITQVYQLLNEHIKLKIPIHPAGEWILDNFYVIDETVKAIKNELSLKKYTKFLGIENGVNKGFARIYVLASEIVNYTDNKIDINHLSRYLKAYQKKKTLNMEEIWNIPMFIQIVLIENIREICEKIYSSQMQKYRVENIIERLVENKNKEELQFTHLKEYKTKVKGYGEMKYPFIEYLSYSLKKYGKKAYPYLNILEEQVDKMGTTTSDVVKKEHFEIATTKISIGNAITSIKTLNRISMVDIFEEINGVEDILKQDPADIYEKMDYQTKILYRNAIKEIANKTNISEIYIAKKVWYLANTAKEQQMQSKSQNNQERMAQSKTENNQEQLIQGKPQNNPQQESANHKKEAHHQEQLEKMTHVGYYLIAQGKNTLWKELTGKTKKQLTSNQKISTAIIILIVVSIAISALFGWYLYGQTKSTLLSMLLTILLLIPSQTITVQLAQYILGKFIKPNTIPKLNLEDGVPEQFATFIVIPSIVNSKEKVQKLMQNLETYYMANQSDNLYFALLRRLHFWSK